MSTSERWRGLAALVADAVEHGSRAVERLQLETADRTFSILEALPPLTAPARGVHAIHDLSVSGVHGAIRLAGRFARAAAEFAIDELETREPADALAADKAMDGAE